MHSESDLAILGGGPAGLGLALALRQRGRSVTVLERTDYGRPRPGETFGGDLGPLLQTLGAWNAFQALRPLRFRGVRSAWGGADPVERASIFHPFGDGWHVDRARFDACLSECAVSAGATVSQGTGACAIERDGDRWRVRPASGPEVAARYLVDASGRGAPASALFFTDRRWLRTDRLVALIGRLRATARPVELLLELEAVKEGWWYSVPQPDGALLAALMTDADLLPARGRTALAEHFTATLAQTSATSARAAGATLDGTPWIARADSGLLLPGRGPGWRALGDAAMACDPLAGDGVTRALRAAIDAAPEIERAIDGAGEPTEPDVLHTRFRDFLEMRASYYAREHRWPDATFWARRRAPEWHGAPFFLDPRRPLRAGSTLPSRDVLAPIESLAPPHALRGLLRHLHEPRPAHVALAWLKSEAPLEDERVLVALHWLVHCGALVEV